MLGNGRLEAYCFDGVKRLCHIRGKMRKKVWISVSDFVLIGLRDFQDTKGDVILKYYTHEARRLQTLGEIPATARINTAGGLEEEDADEEITFGLTTAVAADATERNDGVDAWDAIINQYEEDLEEAETFGGGDDEIDDI